MDAKERQRTQLECLYDMFRDRIDESVIYIVYTENEGRIESTIDQLMPISACALTGHHFESNKSLISGNAHDFVCPRPVDQNETIKNHQQQTTNCCSADQTNGDADSSAGTSSVDGEEDGDLDERIGSLQTAIENLLTEKKICHDKASQYLSKKMFPVTSYYSELASQYRRDVEVKTRKLIDLLLMKSENADTIDLHGLNPIQAKLVVTELLNSRQDKLCIDKQGEASVDIITGWGKHTVAEGNHRIRSTIISLLREKGYDFDHLNKGALRVTLRR